MPLAQAHLAAHQGLWLLVGSIQNHLDLLLFTRFVFGGAQGLQLTEPATQFLTRCEIGILNDDAAPFVPLCGQRFQRINAGC